jgi:hypothetical protein
MPSAPQLYKTIRYNAWALDLLLTLLGDVVVPEGCRVHGTQAECAEQQHCCYTSVTI